MREMPTTAKPGGEAAVVRQPVERGQQFALGEVAVGAEDDHGALGHAAVRTEAGPEMGYRAASELTIALRCRERAPGFRELPLGGLAKRSQLVQLCAFRGALHKRGGNGH